MKYFVQFKVFDLAGNFVDAMGSDGYHLLDARLSLMSMVNEAYTQMAKLKKEKVQNYKHFEIRRGNLKQSSKFTDNFSNALKAQIKKEVTKI